MAKVGFVGLGIMGRPMAGHLIDAGHELNLYNRSAVQAEFASRGRVCASAKEAAERSDTIFIMVPDTPDVEAALFAANGIAAGLSRGKTVVDMSSISPMATKTFAKRINDARLRLSRRAGFRRRSRREDGVADDHGAAASQAAFDRVKPLFEMMGKNITLVGDNGAGQTCKVANQIIVALTIEAVGEALLFACASRRRSRQGAAGADGRASRRRAFSRCTASA